MSLYSRFARNIWRWPQFRKLSPPAKLVFLALVTGPDSLSLPGLLEGDAYTVASATSATVEWVEEQFTELVAAGLVELDRDSSLIRLPHVPAFDPTSSYKVVIGWYRLLLQLPDSPLKIRHVASLLVAVDMTAPSMTETWEETFGTLGQVGMDSPPDTHVEGSGTSTSKKHQQEAPAPAPAEKREGFALTPGKAKKGKAAPKQKDPQKYTFTVEQLGEEFTAGAGAHANLDGYDKRRSKNVWATIDTCQKLPYALADVRLAGEYTAANRKPTLEPIGWGLLVNAGFLTDTIAKAKAWDAKGRRNGVARGTAPPSTWDTTGAPTVEAKS